MRALTVKQPWASLIASGIKQVENRTYPVPKTVRGQRVAIHAGQGFDEWGLHSLIASICRCQIVHVRKPFEAAYQLDSDPDCLACQIRPLEDAKHASKEVSGRILCTAEIVGQIGLDGVPEWFEPGYGGDTADCFDCDGHGDTEKWGQPECKDCEGTFECQNCNRFEACATCSGTGDRYYGISFNFHEPGAYGWILADVELVEDPRIHRGMLGFWTVKGEL